MIGKILAIGLLSISTITSLYKSGKYAAGGQDVYKGKGAAGASFIAALLSGSIAILVAIDF